jgi:hypothetical protein
MKSLKRFFALNCGGCWLCTKHQHCSPAQPASASRQVYIPKLHTTTLCCAPLSLSAVNFELVLLYVVCMPNHVFNCVDIRTSEPIVGPSRVINSKNSHYYETLLLYFCCRGPFSEVSQCLNTVKIITAI